MRFSHGFIVLLCLFILALPVQAGSEDFRPVHGLVKTPDFPKTASYRWHTPPIPREINVTPLVAEDPDWYYLPGGQRPRLSYAGRWGGSSYPDILEEALRGNPLAMADLIIQTQYAPDRLAAALPHFPPPMHTKKYWLDWAARYTSPGWIYARLSLYDEGIGATRRALGTGAELGDPKSMYEWVTGWPVAGEVLWLIVAADAGSGPAAQRVSRWYRLGGKNSGYEISKNIAKGKKYLAIAMQRGYSEAFADAAYDVLTGLQGTPINQEQAYVYTYIWLALRKTENGLLLIERDLPDMPTVRMVNVRRCALNARRDIGMVRNLTPEEKTEEVARKLQVWALPELSEETTARAKRQAQDWLLRYKAEREAELRPERERRAKLTEQLRKECVPALEYLAKRKIPFSSGQINPQKPYEARGRVIR